MGRYQSGQMGQTVNLLVVTFGGSNPSLPTKQRMTPSGLQRYEHFFNLQIFRKLFSKKFRKHSIKEPPPPSEIDFDGKSTANIQLFCETRNSMPTFFYHTPYFFAIAAYTYIYSRGYLSAAATIDAICERSATNASGLAASLKSAATTIPTPLDISTIRAEEAVLYSVAEAPRSEA